MIDTTAHRSASVFQIGDLSGQYSHAVTENRDIKGQIAKPCLPGILVRWNEI
jgi:hypothetical protein